MKHTGEEGIYQVEISSRIENDIREEVFYTFADAKCPILEMSSKVPTLEEVFLRLTGEGTKQFGGKRSRSEKKKMREKLHANASEDKAEEKPNEQNMPEDKAEEKSGQQNEPEDKKEGESC